MFVHTDVTDAGNIVQFGLVVRYPQQAKNCSQAAFGVGFASRSQCLDGIGSCRNSHSLVGLDCTDIEVTSVRVNGGVC